VTRNQWIGLGVIGVIGIVAYKKRKKIAKITKEMWDKGKKTYKSQLKTIEHKEDE